MKPVVTCLLVCAVVVSLVNASPIPEATDDVEVESEVSHAEAVADSSDAVRDKRGVGVAVGSPTILAGVQQTPLAPLVAPLAPLVGPAGLVPVAGVVPTVIGPLNSLLSIPRNLISTVGYQLTTLG
nr:uncharacterized protein LOC109404845 isoform X1 [Aedes albopictus]XP_029729882.1 uncharacterized protein LOC115267164 isoform X1 [Aedes albopictus]